MSKGRPIVTPPTATIVPVQTDFSAVSGDGYPIFGCPDRGAFQHNERMSYGVLVSKPGQVLVETLEGSGGGDSDTALDQFQSAWGAMWVPGRLTVTRLHLTFMPSRAGRGMAMTDIDLRDVTEVELSRSRGTTMVVVRTRRHVTRLRCLGAAAVAQQLTDLVEGLRRSPASRPA